MKLARLFSIAFLCNTDITNAFMSPPSRSSKSCLKNSANADGVPLQVSGSHSNSRRSRPAQADDFRRIAIDGEDGKKIQRKPTTGNRTGNATHKKTKKAKVPSKATRAIDLPYDITIQALRAYESKHSNLVLPRRFVVPATPGEFWICNAVI